MFVAERMTKHPVTVTSETSISDAAKLMKKNHFHRMLIVDNGKLVGYFSDRDVMRVAPSPATTLSILSSVHFSVLLLFIVSILP